VVWEKKGWKIQKRLCREKKLKKNESKGGGLEREWYQRKRLPKKKKSRQKGRNWEDEGWVFLTTKARDNPPRVRRVRDENRGGWKNATWGERL